VQPAVRKDILPGFLDGMVTDQPQATWVNADDFLILGPYLHEHGKISLFKSIVKGLFSRLGRGKSGWHDWGSVTVSVHDRAGSQLVLGTTVRATNGTGLGDIQKDTRVHAPEG